jgi:hypothetical protein
VLAHLPGLHRLDLVHYLVARPDQNPGTPRPLTCSVIVPCRNEVGNIAETVARMPPMGPHGDHLLTGLQDGTPEAVEGHRAYRGSGTSAASAQTRRRQGTPFAKVSPPQR